MNLDHIFLWTVYLKGDVTRISGYRTDRKGKAVGAYTSGIAHRRDDSSHLPDQSGAIADLGDTLGINSNPMVVVSTNPEKDFREYYGIFPKSCIWLDINQLAWPLVMRDQVAKERSFGELCNLFGVEIRSDVSGECVALGQLYWAMMTRYKTSLYGEEVISHAGGNALKTVRNFFGV